MTIQFEQLYTAAAKLQDELRPWFVNESSVEASALHRDACMNLAKEAASSEHAIYTMPIIPNTTYGSLFSLLNDLRIMSQPRVSPVGV
jgi:hypothetical protein